MARRSLEYADAIEDLSVSEYEDPYSGEKTTTINEKNIKRIIRVRNINKHKKDRVKDVLGTDHVKKALSERPTLEENIRDNMVTVTKKRFRKVFKKATVAKFNNVTGVFLGGTEREY